MERALRVMGDKPDLLLNCQHFRATDEVGHLGKSLVVQERMRTQGGERYFQIVTSYADALFDHVRAHARELRHGEEITFSVLAWCGEPGGCRRGRAAGSGGEAAGETAPRGGGGNWAEKLRTMRG